MPRLLSIFLILGLLVPSLGFAQMPEAPLGLPPDDLLPTFFFTDEAGNLLAISPLTDEIFIWSY